MMRRVIKTVSAILLFFMVATAVIAIWKGQMLWALAVAFAAALGLSMFAAAVTAGGTVLVILGLGYLVYGLKKG